MILSFDDYIPVPRYDGIAWTRILVDEAAAATGPWNLIDTIILNPVDTDPTHPLARSFTTHNRTLEDGWYRISFQDSVGNTLRTLPIHNVDYLDLSYKPTLDDVGSLLRTRTKDSAGNELGTFTNDTRPTAEDVVPLINEATATLRSRIGDQIPEEMIPDARRLAALRAAMLVELSYFPEQVETGRSPYKSYEDMWVEGFGDHRTMGTLIQAIEQAITGQPLGPDNPGIAQFSFPAPGTIGTRPF